MENILLYAGIGLGILFVVLLILSLSLPESKLKKLLGPIGLVGIALLVAFGFKMSKEDPDLKRIREENERIRKELDASKAERERLDQELKEIRAKYETKIASLQSSISEKMEALKAAQEKLNRTTNMTPKEWLASLPKEEQDELIQKIRNEIDFT